MGQTTDIAWADSTFNPWIGCRKVSEECDHCYAEALFDDRFHLVEWGPPQTSKTRAERDEAIGCRIETVLEFTKTI